jgi:hypothetical protein
VASVPGVPAARAGVRRAARSFAHRRPGDQIDLPFEGRLPPFTGGAPWLNSAALSPETLRGQGPAGLRVVGVHTPEFGFEHDLDNVVAQVRALGVEHPVVLDNDYAIWQAFANHFWPAVYVADAQGRIRYHHFGEGEYAMTEMVLQRLLLAAGADDLDQELVEVEPHGLEVPADWRGLGSAETYLGFEQGTGFVSQDRWTSDRPHVYAAALRLPLNHWDLTGTWTVGPSAVLLHEAGGRVAFQFRGRDVNLVMGPARPDAPVRFRVLLDGRNALGSTGTDVASDGSGTVREQRCYQLIRQQGSAGERRFEIEFLDAGIEAFCFTFG